MKIVRNPDEVFVRNLKKRIRQNNGYCPCKLEKSRTTSVPAGIFGKDEDATADSTLK